MARIIYGGQLVNLCLLSKDLLNFEPPYRECWLRHWYTTAMRLMAIILTDDAIKHTCVWPLA